MKKLIFVFFVTSMIILVSCAKFADDEIASAITTASQAGSYQLKSANAAKVGDTLFVSENSLIIFTLEKSGIKIKADWNFGNSTPVISGDIVSTKFVAGVYLVKAVDVSVTPNVTTSAIIKARKDVVVIPPTSENSIIVISSTYTSAGVNTMTLGLRCDVISGYNSATPVNAEVQYEMLPSINWTKAALLAAEITTVNTVKYYKWSFTANNSQKVRFSWLIGSSWAYAAESFYRQTDGVYVFFVKDGAILKDVTTSSLPGTMGDVKVRATLENIANEQNLVMYFQKSLFNLGIPSLKYNIDAGAEKTSALAEVVGNPDYYQVKIPIISGQEINFWPLSSIKMVDISGSIVWNPKENAGKIQILNLKSAKIGDGAKCTILG